MTFFSQDIGAGLAVVPLMGLLESIAVAKSFGEIPVTPHPPLAPLLPAHHLLACLPILIFKIGTLIQVMHVRVLKCIGTEGTMDICNLKYRRHCGLKDGQNSPATHKLQSVQGHNSPSPESRQDAQCTVNRALE